MLVLQKLSKGLITHLSRRKSSSVLSSTVKIPIDSPETKADDDTTTSRKTKSNSMIAAAFESLKSDDLPQEKKINKSIPQTTSIDEKILNAKTVNGILSVTESNAAISRKQALKVVSILAEWSSINKVKLSDFENDSRFIKLCRLLGRTVPKNENNQNKTVTGFRTDDLNTVLGIAGDDEAAKLVASISLPQMVRVMTTLGQRKRRSTPLLRSLAYNISSSSENLDLKQCADILYAMAILNFSDSVLSAKICADIQTGLPMNTDKSAVIGSILTSLGLLKYRDIDILESLFNWILKNHEICRPQDLNAMFLTMATLNYNPLNEEEFKTKLVPLLTLSDFPKISDWLTHVWALCLLRFSENKHIESVLSQDFIEKLETEKGGLTSTIKMKLLNINSYAKLFVTNYKGPFINSDSPIFNVLINHNKSKQILLNGMLDALKSLLPSSTHVQSLVDTKMGFLIDALCYFDSKGNPVALNKDDSKTMKIAIMIIDFHDVCQGTNRSTTGLTKMNIDLLEKSTYKVLLVPYSEFNTSDKLLKRVQYLEKKLKDIVNSKNI